jgi:hypothetical protein
MKKQLAVFALLVLLIPCLVSAQLKSQDKPIQIKKELLQPADPYLGFSLFDPSRLTMSHSVSMSYFSMGGRGLSQAMYLNTMQYQISNPLSLSVQWGIQNYPYNSFSKDNPAFRNGLFLSGAELKYQPSDKFEMRFQYSQMPGLYNPYLYRDRLGFSRYQTFGDENY